MVITVSGFKGSLEANVYDAESITRTLIFEGYDVKLDAQRVRINYAPGYEYLIWGEGEYENRAVLESVEEKKSVENNNA
jgi:hypothetical protein